MVTRAPGGAQYSVKAGLARRRGRPPAVSPLRGGDESTPAERVYQRGELAFRDVGVSDNLLDEVVEAKVYQRPHRVPPPRPAFDVRKDGAGPVRDCAAAERGTVKSANTLGVAYRSRRVSSQCIAHESRASPLSREEHEGENSAQRRLAVSDHYFR